jgi:hypothetical protein
MNDLKFELKASMVEELEAFSQILNKTPNQILNEALENYLNAQQEILNKKNQDDENALTNLDYNEFWDDLDFDD